MRIFLFYISFKLDNQRRIIYIAIHGNRFIKIPPIIGIVHYAYLSGTIRNNRFFLIRYMRAATRCPCIENNKRRFTGVFYVHLHRFSFSFWDGAQIKFHFVCFYLCMARRLCCCRLVCIV